MRNLTVFLIFLMVKPHLLLAQNQEENSNFNQFQEENNVDDEDFNENDIDDEDFSENDIDDEDFSENDIDDEDFSENDIDDEDFSENDIDDEDFFGEENNQFQNNFDSEKIEDVANDNLFDAGQNISDENRPEESLDVVNQAPINGDNSDGVASSSGISLGGSRGNNLFSGAPRIPGSMRNLSLGEAPEEYRIEHGDTLFDICDQLLDEAGYWPKLWSLNPYILNPHFIFPGMKLVFYPGSQSLPPLLEVITEDSVVPVNTNSIQEVEILNRKISGLLTSAEKPNRTPIVSIDEIKDFALDEGFIAEDGAFKKSAVDVILPLVVFSDKVDPLGVVVGGDLGSQLIGRDGNLLIEADEGLEIGTVYSILRNHGELRNPATGSFVGYNYEFVAHVKVQSSFAEDKEMFSGRSIFMRTGIQPGDVIAPFQAVKKQVVNDYAIGEASNNYVVGFEFPVTNIAGRGDFIILDQLDGQVSEGSAVKIYQDSQRLSFVEESERPTLLREIATAYVIDNKGPGAVAYLVDSKSAVMLGDRTLSESQGN